MPENGHAEKEEVHVVVGCADARDVGGHFASALEAATRGYAANGIEIELHALRTPGSFVTRDVIDDLRRIVETHERGAIDDVRYFVHIQTHGGVRVVGGREAAPMDRYEIVAGSPFNCGMLGASGASIELEQLLLRERATWSQHGHVRRIEREEDIRELLHHVYAHQGALAGDWIRSIDDLRTHPRSQEMVLREAIRTDRTLRSVDLTITTGIQDYGQQEYFRLDADTGTHTFWDEVYVQLREASAPSRRDERRTAPQAPELGLFAFSDDPIVRQTAVDEIAERVGRPPTWFRANQVFTFVSESFDLPHSPFGPYTVLGFYFAVVKLDLKRFVVVGADEAQTKRMMRRLERDPLVSVIARSFGVEFLPTWLGRRRDTGPGDI